MNRGKDFEAQLRKQLEKGFDVTRLADNTAGYMGGRNICDFICYSYPNLFYFELKSTKGNTLPFANITENQFLGLQEKEFIEGVGAGLIIWYLEKDKTFFVSASLMNSLKKQGKKSIHINDLIMLSELFDKCMSFKCFEIKGTKKRVFFDYDMSKFKRDLEVYLNYGIQS